MRVWIGRSLVLIAALHFVFGLIAFRDVVGPVAREGVFNTVRLNDSSHRSVAFWFFTSGLLLLITGGLVDQSERFDVRFPSCLPWGLLALAVVGSVLMPVSAFWLLFVPAIAAFRRARRDHQGQSAR